MYKRYVDRLNSARSSGNPNSTRDDPTRDDIDTDETDSSIPCIEYFYGNDRKKQNFWLRDHALKLRAFSRWKKTALDNEPELSKEEASAPPEPRAPTPPPPRPKPPAEVLKRALHIEKVDFHIDVNTKKHRTNDFTVTEEREYQGSVLPAELVLRRGDTFEITISFDRPYQKSLNELQLVFSLGRKPKPSKGTLARIFVDESGKTDFKPDQWAACLQGKTGNDVKVLVNIPCNCMIGEWSFAVKLFSEEKDGSGKDIKTIWQYTHDEDITILFNPWCKNDGVYMANEKDLDEYVLNDNGCVYRGNWRQLGAKEWNFGQFEEEILDIALTLARYQFNDGTSKQMADPVAVSRAVAKLVNACDEDGVLVGNWSGDYSDGISPSKWSGSIKILKQWRKEGPVMFGQCWVFSCVTTTVCRALGIPCRSVTNFASAHDTNASNCIEKYYIDRAKNIEDKSLNGDSVWNFHVWNDVWFSRPDLVDLDPEFEFLRESGWQAIDATPQELSEGVFTCGPTPLAAVRRGYCSVNYDTDFVFSEVNSDKVTYERQSDGEYKRVEVLKRSVGKKISTKVADGLPYRDEDEGSIPGWEWMRERDSLSERKRHDVTLEYKPQEGTEEERESVKMAQKTARNPIADNYMEEKEVLEVKPVEFNLSHDNNTMIGSPLKIQLTAKNDGGHDRKIAYVHIIVTPKTYTGNSGDPMVDKNFDGVTLNKGEEMTFDAILEPNDYLSKLIEQASYSVIATAVVEPVGDDTRQMLFKEHDVRFRRPDLEIKCPSATRIGEEVNFEVSFKNPLDIALTDCDISMESAGFKDIDDEKEPDVPPNGEYKRTFKLKANKKAKKHASLTFSFDCKQLKDISGGCSIQIEQ